MAVRVSTWGNHYVNGWIFLHTTDYEGLMPTAYNAVDVGGNPITPYWAFKSIALDTPVQFQFSVSSTADMPLGQTFIIPTTSEVLWLQRATGPGAGYTRYYLAVLSTAEIVIPVATSNDGRLLIDSDNKIITG